MKTRRFFLLALLTITGIAVYVYTRNPKSAPQGSGFEEWKASKNITWQGIYKASHKKISSDLTVQGVATVDDIEVTGKTTVQGPLSATKSKFNKLFVQGSATLSDTTIEGKTTIYGLLNAHHSTFKNLEIYADEIKLSHSKANEIIIKSSDNDKPYKKTLELIDCTIDGPVIFENDLGEILLKGDSVIKGTIKGGTIKKC